MSDREAMKRLLERSSLGTPGARALQAQTDPVAVRRILERVRNAEASQESEQVSVPNQETARRGSVLVPIAQSTVSHRARVLYTAPRRLGSAGLVIPILGLHELIDEQYLTALIDALQQPDRSPAELDAVRTVSATTTAPSLAVRLPLKLAAGSARRPVAPGLETTTTTTETAASINERFEATALPLHDSIYRANLRMTGDPVMAQDLTQETYLRAFRAFDSFQAGTNCRAWMLQISHNLFCRDYRGRKRITYRTAADDDVDVLAQFRADVPNPEEEALRQLDREALRRAISKLPEPYRVAVTLVELQGLSCEEAAAVMGTPKGTVLSRLFRARERLRRLLLSEFGRARTVVPLPAQNS